LKWSDEVFWGASLRKIYLILEIHRDTNDPKKANKKRPSQMKKPTEKISVQEALKQF